MGSTIGVYSPSGVKVGQPGRSRNTEFLVLVGPEARLRAMVDAAGPAHLVSAATA